MSIDDLMFAQKVLACLLVGYLLGSIPFAHMAACRKGIDIFGTGNHQAGTTNVFCNVGLRIGLLVLLATLRKVP